MSVIGLDIGNDTCVIAAAKHRGIDVLLNDESNRENPAIVSFGDKQRFLGSSAAASAMMNPKSTISHIKRLVGLSYREPGVQEELRRLPFETSEGKGGDVLVHVRYLGETHVFTPVQIMGMLFMHLKEVAEKSLGGGVGVADCVIGIPSYFTELQRRGYMNAACIAGLRPLRLMHDCTATALGYGIYKNDFGGGGGPSYVVFFDIGHCDTQVCVAAFESGGMKIVAHAYDRCLGGRDFDEVLFRYFAEKFKEEYCIDVVKNVRASIRLRATCEKLKKVLSANAEAPLNIECLMDEKDVKGFIKREDFEKLSSELLERIRVPCKQALADARLTVEKIHSVELVGSGSRVPAIGKILASLFKREPSRTVNVSECVARGCALQCAMLSPTYRVRDYEIQDSFPFSVGFSSEEGPVCNLSNGILFPKGQPIPSLKVLMLRRSNTFHLEAFYANPSDVPSGISPSISCFTIGPFQSSNAERAKVKVKVQLNLHGIVSIEAASLLEDQEEDHSSCDKEETKTFSDAVENPFEVQNSAQPEPSATLDSKDKKHIKPSRRTEISVSHIIYGDMTKTDMAEAQKKELQLIQQDRLMEQTKDKKNALEAYVYEMRNKLLNVYRSFATDSEREEISRSLQQTEEWLYEDGDDESVNVYNSKLEDLRKLVDPIENRYKDVEARAEAIRDLLKCIVDNRIALESLSTADRDVIIQECNKAEQWLREVSQQQDSLPKNTDPILWSSEIRKKSEELDMVCKNITRPRASPSRPEEAEKWIDLNQTA